MLRQLASHGASPLPILHPPTPPPFKKKAIYSRCTCAYRAKEYSLKNLPLRQCGVPSSTLVTLFDRHHHQSVGVSVALSHPMKIDEPWGYSSYVYEWSAITYVPFDHIRSTGVVAHIPGYIFAKTIKLRLLYEYGSRQ